jgi:hypothetical protein
VVPFFNTHVYILCRKKIASGVSAHTQRHGNALGVRSPHAHGAPTLRCPIPSLASAPPLPPTPPGSSVSTASRRFPLLRLGAAPARPSRSRGRPRRRRVAREVSSTTRPLSHLPIAVSRCPVPQPTSRDLSALLAFPGPRSCRRRFIGGLRTAAIALRWEWGSSRRLSAQDADRPRMQLCYARRCQLLRASASRHS